MGRGEKEVGAVGAMVRVNSEGRVSYCELCLRVIGQQKGGREIDLPWSCHFGIIEVGGSSKLGMMLLQCCYRDDLDKIDRDKI